MLHLLNVHFNQLDAVQQRRVNRMDRFICQVNQIVKAAHPVTLLLHATVLAALTTRIKKSALGTVVEVDFFQDK